MTESCLFLPVIDTMMIRIAPQKAKLMKIETMISKRKGAGYLTKDARRVHSDPESSFFCLKKPFSGEQGDCLRGERPNIFEVKDDFLNPNM